MSSKEVVLTMPKGQKKHPATKSAVNVACAILLATCSAGCTLARDGKHRPKVEVDDGEPNLLFQVEEEISTIDLFNIMKTYSEKQEKSPNGQPEFPSVLTEQWLLTWWFQRACHWEGDDFLKGSFLVPPIKKAINPGLAQRFKSATTGLAQRFNSAMARPNQKQDVMEQLVNSWRNVRNQKTFECGKPVDPEVIYTKFVQHLPDGILSKKPIDFANFGAWVKLFDRVDENERALLPDEEVTKILEQKWRHIDGDVHLDVDRRKSLIKFHRMWPYAIRQAILRLETSTQPWYKDTPDLSYQEVLSGKRGRGLPVPAPMWFMRMTNKIVREKTKVTFDIPGWIPAESTGFPGKGVTFEEPKDTSEREVQWSQGYKAVVSVDGLLLFRSGAHREDATLKRLPRWVSTRFLFPVSPGMDWSAVKTSAARDENGAGAGYLAGGTNFDEHTGRPYLDAQKGVRFQKIVLK